MSRNRSGLPNWVGSNVPRASDSTIRSRDSNSRNFTCNASSRDERSSRGFGRGTSGYPSCRWRAANRNSGSRPRLALAIFPYFSPNSGGTGGSYPGSDRRWSSTYNSDRT